VSSEEEDTETKLSVFVSLRVKWCPTNKKIQICD